MDTSGSLISPKMPDPAKSSGINKQYQMLACFIYTFRDSFRRVPKDMNIWTLPGTQQCSETLQTTLHRNETSYVKGFISKDIAFGLASAGGVRLPKYNFQPVGLY